MPRRQRIDMRNVPLVVGQGIAGAAFVRFLHKRAPQMTGSVCVVESRSQLVPHDGPGLVQFLEPVFPVLDELGVDRRKLRQATDTTLRRYLGTSELPAYEGSFVLTPWNDIAAALQFNAAPPALSRNAAVVGPAFVSRRPNVVLNDGTWLSRSVVVDTSGRRTPIRRALLPDSHLQSAGWVQLNGVTPNAALSGATLAAFDHGPNGRPRATTFRGDRFFIDLVPFADEVRWLMNLPLPDGPLGRSLWNAADPQLYFPAGRLPEGVLPWMRAEFARQTLPEAIQEAAAEITRVAQSVSAAPIADMSGPVQIVHCFADGFYVCIGDSVAPSDPLAEIGATHALQQADDLASVISGMAGSSRDLTQDEWLQVMGDRLAAFEERHRPDVVARLQTSRERRINMGLVSGSDLFSTNTVDGEPIDALRLA
jgi:hypothetical protein